MRNPLARDLDHVLAQTRRSVERAPRRARVHHRRDRILRLLAARDASSGRTIALELDASVVVLTRNGRAFAKKAPHLAAHPAVTLQRRRRADVRVPGRRVLARHPRGDGVASRLAAGAIAWRCSTRSSTARAGRWSSRARRGAQAIPADQLRRRLRTPAAELTHVPEDYAGGPDPTDPAHGSTPRASARRRCCARSTRTTICSRRSRGASRSSGPYLPLDVHFAVGNFIRDALEGGPIQVSGDGTPYRSYLYAADLAVWLWTILLRGPTAAPLQRRFGSGDLDCRSGTARRATIRAGTGDRQDRRHAAAGRDGIERYVPSTARARGRARRDDERRTRPTRIDAHRGLASTTVRHSHVEH